MQFSSYADPIDCNDFCHLAWAKDILLDGWSGFLKVGINCDNGKSLRDIVYLDGGPNTIFDKCLNGISYNSILVNNLYNIVYYRL